MDEIGEMGMDVYSFTIHLDRAPDDAGMDALYEAGLDDCLPVTTSGGHGRLMVSRRADTLMQAIVGVVADISKSGYRATGIDCEDLVTQSDIAAKTGRTRESVRLLAAGKRGPGGFPSPVAAGTRSLYSWAQVREWFGERFGQDVTAVADRDADTLAAADLLLRARLLSTDLDGLKSLMAA
jgi:hypothetical protein